MKCTNCGRLDFDHNEVCPRCGEPLPPGSGEFSSGSRESIIKPSQPPQPAPKAPNAPGPLFAEKTPPPSPPKPTPPPKREPVEPPPPAEPPVRHEPPPVSASPAPKSPTPPPKTPTPPPPDTRKEPPPQQQRRTAPGERSSSSTSGERMRTYEPAPQGRSSYGSGERSSGSFSDGYPSQTYSARSRAKTPPQEDGRPLFKEGGSGLVPEPYARDSATFSSELGTDWIERYARDHVIKSTDAAGMGMRMWAFLIDWLLLAAMGVVILLAGRLVILLANNQSFAPMEQLKILAPPVGALWAVLVFLYFTIFHTASGQTPGKLAMDVRVSAEGGFPPGFGKSALRTMVYLLGLIPFGAGSWWALSNQEKRGWHDLAAKTLVVTVIHKK